MGLVMMGMDLVGMGVGEFVVGVGKVMVRVSVSMMEMRVDIKVRSWLEASSMDFAWSRLELVINIELTKFTMSCQVVLHMRCDHSLHFHCYNSTATVHDNHVYLEN